MVVPLPWLPDRAQIVDGIRVRSGRPAHLAYHGDLEGLTLNVRLIRTASDSTPSPHGTVTLLVGDIDPAVRSTLRDDGRSFLSVDGRVSLRWPGLSVDGWIDTVTAPDTAVPDVPLRMSHQRLAQALLEAHLAGRRFDSVHELAKAAEAVPSSASRLLTKLEHAGLATAMNEGRATRPQVLDVRGLAEVLRERSGFPGAELIDGYVGGEDVSDYAIRVASRAAASGHDIAVTGLAGAVFHGLATSSPRLDLWHAVPRGHDAVPWLLEIGIEPVSGRGNVRVALDREGVGVLGCRPAPHGPENVPVVTPLRLWADLDRSARGTDIADQLWERLTSG